MLALGSGRNLSTEGESGDRSRTRIRRLESAERTEEIARMLSGAKLSDTSRKHAAQLLKANV
jgi:DNA repair protein RecN (Recombination protein N)